MHSTLPQKWACLVLLTSLSATLAKPMPQDLWGDDLSFSPDNPYDVAVAPNDDSIFTDYPPIDGASNNLLLGTTPVNPGFQLAAYSTNCLEVYSPAGSAQRPTCGAPTPYAGCGVADGVIDFDSRYKKICADDNQYCCESQGSVSSAGALILQNCDHLAYTSTLDNIWNGITGFFGTFGVPGSAGSGAGAAAGAGAGGLLPKRDGEFCANNLS